MDTAILYSDQGMGMGMVCETLDSGLQLKNKQWQQRVTMVEIEETIIGSLVSYKIQ